QPAFGLLQVCGKFLDVGASWGYDAPAKNRSSAHGGLLLGRWNVEGAREESTVQVFTQRPVCGEKAATRSPAPSAARQSRTGLHRNSTQFAPLKRCIGGQTLVQGWLSETESSTWSV